MNTAAEDSVADLGEGRGGGGHPPSLFWVKIEEMTDTERTKS